MENWTLTDEQREFAAANHNLIYGYARDGKVSLSKYYDVLAIGLCKAAKMYDSNRASFSTCAYTYMRNELYEHWRHVNRKSAIPDDAMVSYEALMLEYDNGLVSGFIDSPSCEDAIDNVMLEDLMGALNDDETIIVKSLLNGLTQKEIGDKMGCTKQNISLKVKRIREKVKEYLLD